MENIDELEEKKKKRKSKTAEEKYLEAIKYLELITPIKNGLVNKKEYREDIYIQSLKKYFLFTMKYLEFSNRFIITIKDITSTREAVEVQKTFINRRCTRSNEEKIFKYH